MFQTLRQKFGVPFVLLLIALGSYGFIRAGLHHDPVFLSFYPLQWIRTFLYGDAIVRFIEGYVAVPWWPFAEMVLVFLVYTFIFFLLRGLYYWLTSGVEGVSMWGAFAACLIVGFLFLVLILIPVYKQLNIWWEAWSETTAPKVPGQNS